LELLISSPESVIAGETWQSHDCPPGCLAPAMTNSPERPCARNLHQQSIPAWQPKSRAPGGPEPGAGDPGDRSTRSTASRPSAAAGHQLLRMQVCNAGMINPHRDRCQRRRAPGARRNEPRRNRCERRQDQPLPGARQAGHQLTKPLNIKRFYAILGAARQVMTRTSRIRQTRQLIRLDKPL
jgi:hypothetical protein